jgi:type I restriction enzyme S subunit
MRSYPKYKPSGVDWLGEIPDNWNDYKIKFSVNVNQKTLNESTAENFEFNYVDIESVNNTTIEKTQKLTFANAPSRARRILCKGDVIVSTVRTYLKAIAQVPDIEGNIVASTGFAVLSPSKVVFSDYLKYLAVNDYFIQSVVSRSKGANYPAIAPSELVTIKTPIPSINEQQKIVDFLDYKMGQCDRFISNRQKQIELLNEQKAAIINKAVIKGINPNAKMKPSGIDWIGDIPEHWCIWKMTRICEKIGDGLHGTPVYEEGSGIFFINGNNLSNGKIEINENTKEIESKNFNLIKKEISLGSVLYSINGTIGNIAIYNGENILLGKSAAFFVCRSKIINLYLFHYLTSNSVLIHLNSTTEGTTIKNVSLDTLRNLKIPLPLLEEQQSIIDFIKQETSKIEALISKYQKQIELMQEYRTALISQAVTGKIDVRDWQPKTK